jgi:protocatechuate 4,5-dioxygenase, beta chain
MAEIVSVVASTHNPRIFWNRDQASPEDMNELYATFNDVADLLADSRPDCIVTIANDHFDSFFFDNLPAFSIGVGSVAQGPYWYEADIMSLPAYRTAIKQDLAKHLLREGVESGVGFSQTRDVHVDHAFTVPLSFLRPKMDLPIVPIITNAFGYPLPNNMRWYELGLFLKRSIAAWPGKERVAIVASFNLTVEVGGPKMGNIDVEFARWLLELMGKGARTEMLEKLTVERLIAHGNSTTEFLNYVAALGIVEDRLPMFIKHKPVKGVGTCPIAFWSMS